MPQDFQKAIMQRMEQPGWVTTRGILRDPTGQADPDDYVAVEETMKELAGLGQIVLWRLIVLDDGVEMLAAARPGLELDKDLEQRGAWAKAERYEP
ncbi:MAG: hypothetical protein HY914_18965 [Desulfomonile tiedjei]|nr:hypothetical protein [Desulfomonile tiedjei]